MRRYLVIVLICLTLPVAAQISISVGTGAGTYLQGGLKNFQENFASRYNVDAEVNSNFPPYVNYEGSFNFTYSPRLFSEIFFAYGSTGGRVSYSDYSGTVYMNQKVNYMAVMSSFGVRWRKENYQFDVQVRLGRIISKLTLDQYEKVADSYWTHSGKYVSEGGVFEPNFKVTRINGNLGVYASAGLSATVSPSFFESENTVSYISTPQGEFMIAPDWTGLRIAVGLTFILKKAKEDRE
jgi:hypothetical protein